MRAGSRCRGHCNTLFKKAFCPNRMIGSGRQFLRPRGRGLRRPGSVRRRASAARRRGPRRDRRGPSGRPGARSAARPRHPAAIGSCCRPPGRPTQAVSENATAPKSQDGAVDEPLPPLGVDEEDRAADRVRAEHATARERVRAQGQVRLGAHAGRVHLVHREAVAPPPAPHAHGEHRALHGEALGLRQAAPRSAARRRPGRSRRRSRAHGRRRRRGRSRRGGGGGASTRRVSRPASRPARRPGLRVRARGREGAVAQRRPALATVPPPRTCRRPASIPRRRMSKAPPSS